MTIYSQWSDPAAIGREHFERFTRRQTQGAVANITHGPNEQQMLYDSLVKKKRFLFTLNFRNQQGFAKYSVRITGVDEAAQVMAALGPAPACEWAFRGSAIEKGTSDQQLIVGQYSPHARSGMAMLLTGPGSYIGQLEEMIYEATRRGGRKDALAGLQHNLREAREDILFFKS